METKKGKYLIKTISKKLYKKRLENLLVFRKTPEEIYDYHKDFLDGLFWIHRRKFSQKLARLVNTEKKTGHLIPNNLILKFFTEEEGIKEYPEYYL